ncbi:G-protein coupled receptor-associated protein LMBRD2-like [Diadema antillarum]|uniref:G-protein coupled receptor-associated protein LMBRD2-like n=1 Tax=Diadema antillarum TaxID=105358 RepID=UPI003A886EAB
MSVGPLVTEILCVFVLAAYLLHKYGDWRKQHPVVTLTTFISWYFSLIIVFILPLDVTTTFYLQCIRDTAPAAPHSTLASPPHYHILTTEKQMKQTLPDQNTVLTGSTKVVLNGTTNLTNKGDAMSRNRRNSPTEQCKKPWSYVPENILPTIWKIVYWTTFVLTWLIMPFMKSYTNAGDFTVMGKLKTIMVQNAIWYGSYLLIFGVLLICVAAKPELHLSGQQLQVIGITASNTWGLFLLVLLLGYGLVEVPRQYWMESKQGYLLHHTYFLLAKLSTEKSEAEENLEDILEDIRRASDAVRYNHPLRKHVNTVVSKCPEEFQDSLTKHLDDYQDYEQQQIQPPSEKELVRLHSKVIFAMQAKHRADTQWRVLVNKAFFYEDLQRNEKSSNPQFRHTFDPNFNAVERMVCTPTVEWYWRLWFLPIAMKVLAVILALFSLMVIWSEMTFFSIKPVLSLFAIFVDKANENYNFLCIEVLCILIIAYLCVCSYYTVFKVRVFNFYYLAPHHQTDENSLLFCGMMLCRLTPPLCLNFLGMIHLDDHVTGKENLVETSYTLIMGRHIDVLPFMASGFYIYYPILVALLCLATYFDLGSRCLSCLGFQQFVGDDDMTNDLVDEGRELMKRERRKKERAAYSEERKKTFSKFSMQDTAEANRNSRRFNNRGSDNDGNAGMASYSAGSSKAKFTRHQQAEDKVEILADAEPIDYNEEHASQYMEDLSSFSGRNQASNGRAAPSRRGPSFSVNAKPKNIFDDV